MADIAGWRRETGSSAGGQQVGSKWRVRYDTARDPVRESGPAWRDDGTGVITLISQPLAVAGSLRGRQTPTPSTVSVRPSACVRQSAVPIGQESARRIYCPS